jgi:hypothetical protein
MWFNIWFYITLPFRRLKYEYWKIHRAVKFGFQRMFRGYDNADGYEFFSNFVDRNYKLLKYYKEHTWGYPYSLTEEEWDNILDEMIQHLYMMDEHNVTESLKEGMPDGWRPVHNTVWEVMERHKDEFFKLFSKYFYNLWW